MLVIPRGCIGCVRSSRDPRPTMYRRSTTSLVPGRGTYGLVRSAAFQGCKDRRKILKGGICERFQVLFRSGGRADAAAGCCRSIRPATGQHPPGPRQHPPQQPPGVRAASASVGRMLPSIRAASAAPLSGAAPRLCGRFLYLFIYLFYLFFARSERIY